MINIPDDKWKSMLLQAKAIEEAATQLEKIDISSIDALVPQNSHTGGLTDELFYQAASEWGISPQTAEQVMTIYNPSIDTVFEQMKKYDADVSCKMVGHAYHSALNRTLKSFINSGSMELTNPNYCGDFHVNRVSFDESKEGKKRLKSKKNTPICKISFYENKVTVNVFEAMLIELCGDNLLKIKEMFPKYKHKLVLNYDSVNYGG